MRGGKLYYTTNLGQALDSAALAPWVSAVATIVLAIFAIAAWRSSRKQLTHMKADSLAAEVRSRRELEAAEARATDTILASSNLESRREMDSAQFSYLSAHADLFAASAGNLEALQRAQVNLRKASIRFIMVYEFPGLTGEITNFDELMMFLAEARARQNDWRLSTKFRIEPDGERHQVISELAIGMQYGFTVVSNGLRDLYQERVDPLEFCARLPEAFIYLANKYEDHLPESYVKTARERGWMDPSELE